MALTTFWPNFRNQFDESFELWPKNRPKSYLNMADFRQNPNNVVICGQTGQGESTVSKLWPISINTNGIDHLSAKFQKPIR